MVEKAWQQEVRGHISKTSQEVGGHISKSSQF